MRRDKSAPSVFFESIDPSGATFDDFLNFYISHYKLVPPVDRLIQALHYFDPADEGRMTVEEFREILRMGPTPLTEEEIKRSVECIENLIREEDKIDYVLAAQK